MLIEKYSPELNSVCRIPGICVTPAGTILIVYECRCERSDWAKTDIALRRSVDGGKSFSKKKIIVHGGGKTVNNPVLIADAGKTLLLWQEEYKRTFIAESFDDGISFINKTELTEQLKRSDYAYTVIACGPGHGVAYGKGKYIVPVWMAENENPHAHHPSRFSALRSVDGGKSWSMAELLDAEGLTDPSEASAVLLENGKVLLNIRNENPVQKRYLTYLDPETLQFEKPGFCESLTDPTCYAGMTGGAGNIFYSGCDDEEERINLKIKQSTDSGRTFRNKRLISLCGGYSDIALSKDGSELYVFYEKCEGESIELHFCTVGC